MNTKTIFCFWEPQARMPAYLRLCMRTWSMNMPDHEIVVLNHSNLTAHIGGAAYDMTTLKKLALPLQKDAVMVAVLKERGGVFMDIDTIATADMLPIVRHLRHAEVVMFNVHMAFLAARPNALLLTRWMNGVEERLRALALDANFGAAPTWDYLGNRVLADVTTQMVSASALGRAYESIQRRQHSWPASVRAAWRRVAEPIWARSKRTAYRKYLRMLNRVEWGFIAEAAFYRNTTMTPIEQYRTFWFNSDLGVATALRKKQRLIGLHNSWTPDWYKALSEKEVLENECLLSKTLRHVLSR